jgi:ribonucleoside-diphosphate reductase alpha chain
MQVLKRDGRLEPVHFEKITNRLRKLCEVEPRVSAADVSRVAQHACAAIHDHIKTETLDQITADAAVALATEHPDYSVLAARILVSNLQKSTHADVLEVYSALRHHVSEDFFDIVKEHAAEFTGWMDYSRDYQFDYFGFKTLQKAYLLEGERPQHMYLRVAVGIWGRDLPRARETYDALSRHLFTHASPTLFNAGTKTPQLASCFLMGVHTDSLDSIFEAFHKAATISKYGGGIGLHVHSVRSRGSLIRSTNGTSDGLVPMLKVANEVINYVNQSGRRKGSCAIYLEPHHADILQVLDLKRNQGDEHLRARDLFYAMWISDLFMERVEANAAWSLFDPGTAPGLDDVHGQAYRALYLKYEAEGRAVKVLPAQDVWFAIMRLQIETGVPYMVYKDAVNAKSNQQNLGTIKSSNLCSEVVQFTAEDEIAVCNLGSLSLPAFVREGAFDYAALHSATKILTRNLDRVIDVTFYPLEEARRSNLRHRPIGLGVQGLADVFFQLRLPFDSPGAAEVNRRIFATIYHAAVKTSCELAAEAGPYESFAGSPAAAGRLQFDLWDAEPHPMYDWDALKLAVQELGLKNSLLVAPMPTASTAQILGNTEAFEPVTSNLYSRTTLAGTFTVVNKYLLNDLMARGLWTPALKQQLVGAEGSVQSLEVPDDLKALYKTAYELSMKTLIDMAADRGVYVDQSMSLNMFVAAPTFRKLSSMHFYAWRKGLKTGMYYLRSKAASGATKITVDSKNAVPKLSEPEVCVACSG